MISLVKRKYIFSGFFCLAFVLISKILPAQIKDICENKVPHGWQAINGNLSISKAHFKAGKESVLWKWNKPNASLIIEDTAFASVAANPRSSFVIWIYSDKPTKSKLLFDFEKNGKKASSFSFNLDFKGWRTAWIMYHRDMSGKPVEGMEKLVVHSFDGSKSGSLYLDQILYNIDINPRSPMRDEQVPFVNIHSEEAANAHWTALYSFTRKANYLPLPKKVSPEENKDLSIIFERYENVLLSSSKFRKYSLPQLQKAYNYWQIKRNGDQITGKMIYSRNDDELFPKNTNKALKGSFEESTIRPYSELMLNIAGVYRISKDVQEKEILAKMFIDMIDNMEDQGWAPGSGMGALHHLGYNFSSYYSACLLMKQVLKEQHRFDKTWKTMYWFSGLGRTQPKIGNPADFNIDVFNTLLGSMLSTILMMDQSPDKVRHMYEFSNWLSQATMPTYSIDGTFKPDGSVVHHGTLYPAYGIGGFQGITPVIYCISKTLFHIAPAGQESLKKVLLTMHYYTNPIYWPVDVSGRHPTKSGKVPEEVFAYMALAGTPDGKQDIDKEMAGIYLDIIKNPKDKWAKKFEEQGVKPAPYPQGHWDINYGLLDIHRRGDWLLTVRGHNRYFVANESYPGANMYGRYSRYGQLDVTYQQTKKDDGAAFKDKGWDWNNIPGTTTLHQPLNKLRANIVNADDYSGVEEMLLSDEIFAGGTNFNQWQGMFAMILHGNDKYAMGSFYAHKSYFMFDSLIVCLGSNISNSIQDYPTNTTLFQNYLSNNNAPFYVNGESGTSFPYARKWNNAQGLTIIDSRNIGYYIPSQENVEFTRQEQISRDQTDNKDTRGDIGMLVFHHGSAPQNQSYEYAMLIETNASTMKKFKEKMQSAYPVYKVLRKDALAHTVYYAPKHITATALFTSNLSNNDSIIIANNRPCLLMYQKTDDSLCMSVTDPDLAFYTGPDDSPILPNGKRKEVSIYSRSWYKTAAKASVIILTIKGRWKMTASQSEAKTKILANGTTQLSIPCKYGLASKVALLEVDK